MAFELEQALIDITFEGRTLQLRQDQLTINAISRAFRLIPETVLLISERGTVAIPDDGVFSDVDEMYTWTVEGDKVTTHSSSGRNSGPRLLSTNQPVATQVFHTNRTARGSNVSFMLDMYYSKTYCKWLYVGWKWNSILE